MISLRTALIALTIWCYLSGMCCADPFAIQVIDADSGRGVPLVSLRITPDQVWVTDSNGYAAIDEAVLMGRRVFFHVASHGYEHAQDGFGYRGTALEVNPGGAATIRVNRTNIAERLYRITGRGSIETA